jgi:hypothetical protein
MRRHEERNAGEGAKGQGGFWEKPTPPEAQNQKPASDPLSPHSHLSTLKPLRTVARASSPWEHGQDARTTAIPNPGAQASSLCRTGKMPVVPPPALPATLTKFLSLTPGRAALLWGEPFRPLAAAASAWGVARGARVLVVDAANAFDPYRLVREARGRGISRAAALSRVRVARAFTSHQLVRLLKEELAGELEPLSLILVLGPVSLFYDEQIPLPERRRLFKNMVDILAACKNKAPLLLLQPPIPRGAVNRRFGQLLAPLLDYLVRVSGEEDKRKGRRTGGRVANLPLRGT